MYKKSKSWKNVISKNNKAPEKMFFLGYNVFPEHFVLKYSFRFEISIEFWIIFTPVFSGFSKFIVTYLEGKKILLFERELFVSTRKYESVRQRLKIRKTFIILVLRFHFLMFIYINI
jgi:hypothetical protein